MSGMFLCVYKPACTINTNLTKYIALVVLNLNESIFETKTILYYRVLTILLESQTYIY